MRATLFLIPTLLVLAVAIGCDPGTSAASREPEWDKSEVEQQSRKALVDGAIQAGIFTKIEFDTTDGSFGLCDAYVGDAFYALSIDDKQNCLSVVWLYLFDRATMNSLHVKDGRSGKRVGTYSMLSGYTAD